MRFRVLCLFYSGKPVPNTVVASDLTAFGEYEPGPGNPLVAESDKGGFIPNWGTFFLRVVGMV